MEVKPGSYTELPKNVHITEYGTLLAQGKVVRVTDADTITILGSDKKRYKIRLQGIDAPEKKQNYGAACKDKLSAMVLNRRVDVEAYKKDRYKRVIAKVMLGDKDMALELIKQGCGWHYKAYADEQSWSDQRNYAAAEKHARNNKLGLWRAARPQAPWDYRKR
uniref:Endonuclease YncB, thermonuclease family n=1 Tax=uncultured Thiotrichaceae bacterium TaxID=298394 RepID=A0A6S6TBE7_9GAMM|nr:MAG: Endonuclease YncB, thermonuclease family [uncultured Thiotrichaceae bacterium]